MHSELDPPARDTGSTAVGVDIGGTKVLGVRLRRHGDRVEVLERVHLPVARGREGSDGVAHQVADVASMLSIDSPGVPVGVGVAGYVGLDGIPARSPNVPQVVGVDLGAAVTERLGVHPVVDNDANCVAVAARGLHRPAVSDLVALTFGTGIGGGLVVGGSLVRGARGFAGEPGHMVVQPGGIECVCGQHGCWERYASGTRLTELAADAFARGRIGGHETGGGTGTGERPLRVPAGELLVEAVRAGDGPATELMEDFCGWLALGVANIVNLLDPELVVVGGGLSAALDVLAGPLEAHLRRMPTVADRVPPVVAAPMAEASGAVGAALMALEADPGGRGTGSAAGGCTG